MANVTPDVTSWSFMLKHLITCIYKTWSQASLSRGHNGTLYSYVRSWTAEAKALCQLCISYMVYLSTFRKQTSGDVTYNDQDQRLEDIIKDRNIYLKMYYKFPEQLRSIENLLDINWIIRKTLIRQANHKQINQTSDKNAISSSITKYFFVPYVSSFTLFYIHFFFCSISVGYA